jgi:predicted nucleic acid-binding protein
VLYVLDTHAVVWFLEGDPRLGPRALEVLNDPTADLVLPTIVLAEITYLYGRGRIPVDVPKVHASLASAPRCVVYPLDEAVVDRLPPTLSIHDAIIVATARAFKDPLSGDVAVVTRDAEITSSGLVDVVW